jgi:thioredoxin-related protein
MNSIKVGGRWTSLGFACVVTIAATVATAQEPEKKSSEKPNAGAATRASIYDKSADANVQVAKATERAKKGDKRILLMFGGDWCGWCHKLHGLFKSNREIAQILYNEYELVTVELESPNAATLLTTSKNALTKEELQKGVGYPFLAVLDAEGKVINAQRTNDLEEGDHHDPTRVAAFLEKWKVPAKDAKLVLDEALARASSDDKRVFLAFGAPWCGWCHRLHDWMAQPEITGILDRDYVITHIDVDRMTGGKEVQKRYQPATSGGIPWYAILDAQGKALATSDGPGGNIGYPAQPQEIAHFLSMLKGQAHRIDAGQLDQIRKSLEEAAERIKRPARGTEEPGHQRDRLGTTNRMIRLGRSWNSGPEPPSTIAHAQAANNSWRAVTTRPAVSLSILPSFLINRAWSTVLI